MDNVMMNLKAWHEVCIYLSKDNAMSAIPNSFFVFHIDVREMSAPKPAPEWPPVEPAPVPPTTDPVPVVPPVTGVHFEFYSFMLN